MALTKPRAYQIFNLDYKQAVRVLTASNITLSGGAPNSVDGVNLVANDRVLVKGQNTGSQNGLYIVSTVGTGSNGTWVRSVDGNETGEIQAGMIVMVTEGDIYKDSQWKLTTNDPITVGVTALTFELNATTNQILNGNTNITIASLGGNANVSVGGVSNVAVFTTTGLTAGNIATDGNIVVGNNLVVNGNLTYVNVTDLNIEDPIIGLGRGPNNAPLTTDDNKDRGTQLWYYTDSEKSAFVGWDDSAGKMMLASNVSISNEIVTVNNYGNLLTGNIEATGNLLPTANITYDLGSTSARWRDIWLSNSTIYMGTVNIGTVGNVLTINGANVLTGNAGAAFSTTGNITGGNVLTGGIVSATGNIISAANVSAGNLRTTGLITATGNITGNYFIGNGSQLTGLQSFVGATGPTGATGVAGTNGATGLTGATGGIGATGASGAAGTNGATGLTGATGVAGTNGATGLTGATGPTGATGTFSGTLTSNIDGGGFNISNVSSVSVTGTVSATGNITAGNVIATGLSGTLSTSAQTNITLLGTLSSLSITGNVQSGNVRTVGLISAAGNVTGGNLIASANLSAGNITTSGIVSATGNITGNYFIGNGSQLTGLQSFVGATGPTGATGLTGATGTAGTNGGIGATGASGVAGGVGATGASGVAGGIGATGATGVAGTNGATGLTGATGSFSNTLTANIDGAGFSISNVGTVAATTLISATGNIQGGNIRTAGLITATGAITGAAITGSSLTVSTGNITAGNLLLSGAIVDSAQLDIQTSAANANIAMTPNGTGIVTVSTQLSAVGNVSGGNIRTAGLITATGNIQAGNILTAGLISATSTITSAANVIGGNISTAGLITATGNVQAGNIRTAGLITATGAITGGALTGTSLTVSTGNITTGNIVNANANGVGNIGSATTYFNTVFAKATSAQYADLAEKYTADADYAPGTVVMFGGTEEVTITTQSHSTQVAGIVSTNPSYLMNAAQTGKYVVAVALVGRVPCQVIGTIAKGDRLVASDHPGVAQRLDPSQYEPACIIGKALENHDSDQLGVIEVAVGRT